MARVEPRYPRDVVNRAARVLVDGADIPDANEAFEIISNWRSSHSFPLNTFQTTLRIKAQTVDAQCLVAQRLKRLSSIALKLGRFPEMKLTQMQDIAGCRAIVQTVTEVKELAQVYKRSDIKHKLVHEDDYIEHPKASGYRGVHLVYRYNSDRKKTFNGLKVEMQFRSVLQHAWATAVETVGTFIQQALKSSQGEEDWLRFFVLMSGAMAIREKSPLVPGIPASEKELYQELRAYARKLKVQHHLQIYAEALQAPELAGTTAKDAHYFLLELDPIAKRIKVTGYKAGELERASSDYLEVERRALSVYGGSRDAVLVSVESVEALKRAYPNYFLDTHRFIGALNRAIKRRP